MKTILFALPIAFLISAPAFATPVSKLKGPVYQENTQSIIDHEARDFINRTIIQNCESTGKYVVISEKNQGTAFEVKFSYAGTKATTGYIVIRDESSNASGDFSLIGMDCL